MPLLFEASGMTCYVVEFSGASSTETLNRIVAYCKTLPEIPDTFIGIGGGDVYKRQSTGRAFMAIRENTVAAGGMGINVRRYKILAFVISAVFASVAGSMYAHFIGFISPETFNSAQSNLQMTMLLFGGMGNPVGPVSYTHLDVYKRQTSRSSGVEASRCMI